MNKKAVNGIIGLIILSGVIWGVYFITKKTDFAKSEVGKEAKTSFNSGNIDEAIDLAEAALTKNPNDIGALEFLASAYAQKGSVEYKESEYGAKAEEVANKIISIDPNNVEALRTLGYSEEIRNNFDKAIGYYTKAISIDASNADVFSNRAHAYWLSGKSDLATKDYENAISLNPNLGHALSGLARIKFSEGKNDEVLSLLSKSLESADLTYRQKASAEQMIGSVYVVQTKTKEALEHFDKAIALDPKMESAFLGRGRTKVLQLGSTVGGDDFRNTFMSAVSDFNKAIEINPNFTLAYVAMGELLSAVKDSNAKTFYTEALRVMPNDNTLTTEEKTLLAKTISK